MDVEDLIAQACATTGLDDFGGDSYREGLDVLVDSVDREAQLNEIARAPRIVSPSTPSSRAIPTPASS